MKTGKITAKLRDAVPVCLMVNGKEVKRYKNIELPDELKEVEMTDFHFNVHMDGKITFEIHYEEGTLPEVFPEAHTRVSRMAKAASQESAEVMAVETTEPETEAAPEDNPQDGEIPAKAPSRPATEGNEPEGIKAAYNVTGVRRKQLMTAVGDFIGTKPEYLRAPTYAFADSHPPVLLIGILFDGSHIKLNLAIIDCNQCQWQGLRRDKSPIDTDFVYDVCQSSRA